jgi:hypothetical protein
MVGPSFFFLLLLLLLATARACVRLRTSLFSIPALVADVLLAAFYGALRGILQAKSAPRKDEARLRRTACMWVAMRPPASGVTINWGNSLGALYVPLLLEEADPVSRLRAVHESNLR